MSKQLNDTEVARVVAEVTRQAQTRNLQQHQVLERQHVIDILQELNLPTDLLDPAMKELERRDTEAAMQRQQDEALRARRRRKFLIISAVLALVLVVVLFGGMWMRQRSQAFSAITATAPGRITLATDDGGNLTTIQRDGAELVYRVTLDRVPLSENLSLRCNWIAPDGRIAKTNAWQTKSTDKTVWPTSCRNVLGTAVEPGNWRVEMLLDDRVISQTGFRVE